MKRREFCQSVLKTSAFALTQPLINSGGSIVRNISFEMSQGFQNKLKRE